MYSVLLLILAGTTILPACLTLRPPVCYQQLGQGWALARIRLRQQLPPQLTALLEGLETPKRHRGSPLIVDWGICNRNRSNC